MKKKTKNEAATTRLEKAESFSLARRGMRNDNNVLSSNIRVLRIENTYVWIELISDASNYNFSRIQFRVSYVFYSILTLKSVGEGSEGSDSDLLLNHRQATT